MQKKIKFDLTKINKNKKLFLIICFVLLFLIFLISFNEIVNEKANFSEVDADCVLWYDGCNYCEIDFSGALVCTDIVCERENYDDPFCKIYLGEEKQDNNNFVVGYCPSMLQDALDFKEENEFVILREFQSASDVLLTLENNNIDLAIIGRKAKQNELSINTKEIMKESSFVIVFNQKVLIETSALKQIPIHTHHPNYPNKYFSDEKVFIHSSLEETILQAFANDQPALITWEEFKDDFELVVVMDNSLKNKDFRGVFYYTPN